MIVVVLGTFLGGAAGVALSWSGSLLGAMVWAQFGASCGALIAAVLLSTWSV